MPEGSRRGAWFLAAVPGSHSLHWLAGRALLGGEDAAQLGSEDAAQLGGEDAAQLGRGQCRRLQ